MTKKHYIALAEVLKELRETVDDIDIDEVDNAINQITTILKNDNLNFNCTKFLSAIHGE